MLMGGLGVGASAAMFAGALLGTYALLATEGHDESDSS